MLFVREICKEKIKNYIGKILGNYYKKEQKKYIVSCERLDEKNSYSIIRIKNEKEPIVVYEELREDTLKLLKGVLGNLELELEKENKRKEKNK